MFFLSFISAIKRSLLSFQAGLYKVLSAEAAISRSVFEFYCVLIKHQPYVSRNLCLDVYR